MKKVYLFFIGILVVLFAGCDLIPKKGLEEDEVPYPFEVIPVNLKNNTKTSVKFDNNGDGYVGDVLLFKYNLTSTSILKANTGYAKDISIYSDPSESKLNLDNNKNELRSINFDSVEYIQRNQWDSISKISDFDEDDPFLSIYEDSTSTSFKVYSNVNDTSSLKNATLNSNMTLEYQGTYCDVYYTNVLDSSSIPSDIKTNLVSNYKIKNLGQTFDSVYPSMIKYLGTNKYTIASTSKYISHNSNKINIIVMDINSDASSSQTTITRGYYLPQDMLKTGNGNASEIIYIDSYSLYKNEKITYSTMIHEFNHLLNDVQKVIKGTNTGMETWYTEMLSMLAEDMFVSKLGLSFGQSPKSRFSEFPGGYYLGFENWDYTDSLANYCNAFAYGSFLVRNYGGVSFLKEIATNSSVNKASINAALKSYNISYAESLKEYYKATYNCNSTGKTFNRAISNNSDGLGFTAINLEKIAQKNGSWVDVRPNLQGAGIDDRQNLLISGCTIHLLGTNVTEFTYIKPSTYSVDMEIVLY